MTERHHAKCASCKFWEPEFSALDQEHRKLIAEEMRRRIADALDKTYGKCRATYVSSDGETSPPADFGTFGVSDCRVTDDKGNFLYSPVPEG